jgi:hypothetical protein
MQTVTNTKDLARFAHHMGGSNSKMPSRIESGVTSAKA